MCFLAIDSTYALCVRSQLEVLLKARTWQLERMSAWKKQQAAISQTVANVQIEIEDVGLYTCLDLWPR